MRLAQVEARPFCLRHGVRPNEGQREQLQPVPRQVVPAPLVTLDVTEELRELQLIGQRRALLLAVLGEPFVEVNVGERRMLDPALALRDPHDLAGRRDHADAGRLVELLTEVREVRGLDLLDRQVAEHLRRCSSSFR